MTLLPSECPNCGHRHEGADFKEAPGPIQKELAEAKVELDRLRPIAELVASSQP